MNTELLDDDLRASLAASLPIIEYVDPPERDELVTEPQVTEKPEQPKLNRAERRRLQRYIIRKARRQIRKVEQRQGREIRELRGKRCPRCNLLSIGRAKWRCQCKAIPQRHVENEAALRAMREAEQTSAAEAQRRLYELREWDDEQHRLAQENGANTLV